MIRTGFLPNLWTSESLESTGNLDLINDQELKEKIIVYNNAIASFSENTTNNNTTLVDELLNQKFSELTFFKTNSISNETLEWRSANGNRDKGFDKGFGR